MTRNAEDAVIEVKRFGGVDVNTDIFDVPLGQFSEAWNLVTLGDQIRTRDGYRPVSTRLFAVPFIIPDSWPDSEFWLRYGRDGMPGGGLSTDGEITIVASPNHDIYMGSDHVDVTFIVYIRGSFTISSYSWDFSYDGVTANADTTGAATSVSNAYTAAGTYTVRVSGTGSDSKAYFATTTIQIFPYKDTTADCTIEAWTDNPYLKAGESADIQYRSTNAEAVLIDGRSTLVLNGLQTVRPTQTTTYMVQATNTKPSVATTSVTIEVEPTNVPPTENDPPPTINAMAAPAEIASGGTATLTWETTNAVAVTCNGATVDTAGAETVNPTATTTYSFVATGSDGQTAQAVATVTVGTPSTATPGRISLTGADVEHNTDFNVVVSCTDAGGANAAAFPAAPILDMIASQPSGVTFTTDASPTANTGSSAYTFEDLQFDLPAGVDLATCVLQARVPNYGNLIPGQALFTVVRKSADFLTECCDVTGAGITSAEITTDGKTATTTFYVRITAQTVGAGTTLTTFNKPVKIVPTVTGWPDAPQIVYAQWCNKSDFNDGTGVDVVDGIIPGAAFLGGDAGICSVKTVVTLPLPSFSDSHYCDLSLTAQEYIGG